MFLRIKRLVDQIGQRWEEFVVERLNKAVQSFGTCSVGHGETARHFRLLLVAPENGQVQLFKRNSEKIGSKLGVLGTNERRSRGDVVGGTAIHQMDDGRKHIGYSLDLVLRESQLGQCIQQMRPPNSGSVFVFLELQGIEEGVVDGIKVKAFLESFFWSLPQVIEDVESCVEFFLLCESICLQKECLNLCRAKLLKIKRPRCGRDLTTGPQYLWIQGWGIEQSETHYDSETWHSYQKLQEHQLQTRYLCLKQYNGCWT